MLNQALKNICKRLLRVLMTPIRKNYSNRNGITSNENRMEIPNEILLTAVRDAIREGHTATIYVKGWSMRPFLEHQRDKVLLEGKEEYLVGDAVLAEIHSGHFVLHRIIKIEGDNITLMGDGNIHGTEHCQRKDICGVVTEYIRPTRTILASNPVLINRIKLWRKLLPIRRYLLFIYKGVI